MLMEKKVVLKHLYNLASVRLEDAANQIVINSAYEWTLKIIEDRLNGNL